MKITTWNVNSLTVRLEHILLAMSQFDWDIVGIQETKTPDTQFPLEGFVNKGYYVSFAGQKTYNGVCFISKMPLTGVQHRLPTFMDDPQRRFMTTDLTTPVGQVHLINGYFPNGSEVDSEKYAYKLKWLSALNRYVESVISQHEHVIVMGDYNIAPANIDLYNAEEWGEKILCSPAEREAFRALEGLGFTDVFRHLHPESQKFSWWDYRGGAFRKDEGFRIDLILASNSLLPHCQNCVIETRPRAWERPSDHAPVTVTLG